MERMEHHVSAFSGLQWTDCRVLKLHCDWSRAYRMGANWQPLKRYYMCSPSPSFCLTGALGMKGKSSGKRDIGSRHGEGFVSILPIPSLPRNPNFHHSLTYRQIKAGWRQRGGFLIETSCNRSAWGGEQHKAVEQEKQLWIGRGWWVLKTFSQKLMWSLAGSLWAESLSEISDKRHETLSNPACSPRMLMGPTDAIFLLYLLIFLVKVGGSNTRKSKGAGFF